MSHVPHELAEEFPAYRDTIHDLKRISPHFANLAEQYHDVNRAIHRYETRVEPVDERPEQGLRMKRMVLKDQIYAMLRR
ncbi:MAG: DUF465 domain-containing protein [Pseudomonadota bacterium]